jgi:hypothetical protein
MATGLAVWGWTLRLVVTGSLFALPYVVTSMTPLVENGSQVQALVARYPDEVATLNAIDPSTQAQLQADPTNTTAINTAVTEISQNLHVSSAVALQDLTAVAQVPRDDLTFLAAHGPEVQRAAAASPGEWRRWWWVCVGGEALLLPFLFVMKGRWSPRRARADLEEHERAVQQELVALQKPRAA